MSENEKNIFDLDDDEFLKQPEPQAESFIEAEQALMSDAPEPGDDEEDDLSTLYQGNQETSFEDILDEKSSDTGQTGAGADSTPDSASKPESGDGGGVNTGGGDQTTPPQTKAGGKDTTQDPADETKPDGGETPDPAQGADGNNQQEQISYEDFYKQVMQPIKAAGKKISPESPDDVVRLMQMGADYTRKMQKLQPHMKTVRMLQNAELLDHEKLNFLIDVANKDKGAIQKLIKESGIDPLDLTDNDAASYQPGNHQVSDDEVAFTSALEDVLSEEGGRETISHISETWDDSSKDQFVKEPQLLRIFHEQRANGIYDVISEEITRQKALGRLDGNLPFIQAYQQVGDHLHKTGKLTHLLAEKQTEPRQPSDPAQADTARAPQSAPADGTAQPEFLERRTATSPGSRNNEGAKRARAAASAPGAPSNSPSTKFDPLNMSDEEIMKIASTGF